MITIQTASQARELIALADEIQAQHAGMTRSAALVLAGQELHGLLADVAGDTRYRPAKVVMFERLTARELYDMTER
jgi:uncharacterized membrane protein YdcZ (DUF606 family)